MPPNKSPQRTWVQIPVCYRISPVPVPVPYPGSPWRLFASLISIEANPLEQRLGFAMPLIETFVIEEQVEDLGNGNGNGNGLDLWEAEHGTT